MKLESLHDLLIACVKDLYSAESQISKIGLPAMIQHAEGELKKSFEKHLKQTEAQIERLNEVSAILEIKLGGKKCVGMEGIIAEADEDIKLNPEGNVKMAALIGGASKVEHYEIAGYTSAIMLCKKMGHSDIEELLQASLDEEIETSEKLTMMAEDNVSEETME